LALMKDGEQKNRKCLAVCAKRETVREDAGIVTLKKNISQLNRQLAMENWIKWEWTNKNKTTVHTNNL